MSPSARSAMPDIASSVPISRAKETCPSAATASGPAAGPGGSPAAEPAPGVPLLEVRGLCVTLPTARGPVQVLRDVSFPMARGQTLGILGQSGFGQSMTALALMGLLPEGSHVSGPIPMVGQQLPTLYQSPLFAARSSPTA